MIIDKRKKRKNALEMRENRKILDRWRDSWDGVFPADESYEWYKQLFEEVYEEVCAKSDENKKRNILGKKIFVIISAIGFISYIGCYLLSIKKGSSPVNAVLNSAFFLSVFLLAGKIVSKWLEIKKYQETWSRHSKNKFFIQKEMMYFIYDLSPYNTSEKRSVFIVRIFNVLESNMLRFEKNMKKEEKLDDIANYGIKVLGKIKQK